MKRLPRLGRRKKRVAQSASQLLDAVRDAEGQGTKHAGAEIHAQVAEQVRAQRADAPRPTARGPKTYEVALQVGDLIAHRGVTYRVLFTNNATRRAVIEVVLGVVGGVVQDPV